MKNSTDLSCETRMPTIALLAQADLLLLSADLLRRPDEARRRIAGLMASDIAAVVEASQLSPRDPLVEALNDALIAAWEFDPDAWSDEFHRLFEGAMVCPLNETAFIRRDKGAILGDLAGYYRAFGWQPAGDTGEKLDHLLTELEFAAVLLTMAAQAGEAHNAESADVTHRALASFVQYHLGDWLPGACAHLGLWTSAPYYRAVAEALGRVWRALVEAHGWPMPDAAASPAPHDADDTPYECGAPDANPVPVTIRGQVT